MNKEVKIIVYIYIFPSTPLKYWENFPISIHLQLPKPNKSKVWWNLVRWAQRRPNMTKINVNWSRMACPIRPKGRPLDNGFLHMLALCGAAALRPPSSSAAAAIMATLSALLVSRLSARIFGPCMLVNLLPTSPFLWYRCRVEGSSVNE